MTENKIEKNITDNIENIEKIEKIDEKVGKAEKYLAEGDAEASQNDKSKGLTDDNKVLFIKAVFILILALFLIFVYSRNDAKSVKQEELTEALLSKTNITDVMSPGSNRDVMQFFALDAGAFEYTIYYRNKTALAVDELLIVKANNTSELSSVDDAVSKRIDSQITAYESYGPEQVKLLENAVTVKKGKYFIYCTAKDADKYEEVLLNVIQ